MSEMDDLFRRLDEQHGIQRDYLRRLADEVDAYLTTDDQETLL